MRFAGPSRWRTRGRREAGARVDQTDANAEGVWARPARRNTPGSRRGRHRGRRARARRPRRTPDETMAGGGRARRWGASVGSGRDGRRCVDGGRRLLLVPREERKSGTNRRTLTHRVLHHRSLVPRHTHFHAVRHARGGRHEPRGRRILQPRHGDGRGATRSECAENGCPSHIDFRKYVCIVRTASASEIWTATTRRTSRWPRWPRWRRAPPCPSARRHTTAAPCLAPPSPPAARGRGEWSLLDSAVRP